MEELDLPWSGAEGSFGQIFWWPESAESDALDEEYLDESCTGILVLVRVLDWVTAVEREFEAAQAWTLS